MIRLFWHLWLRGHAIRVNRDISVGWGDTSKGWLYTCECGETVAR